MSGRRRCALLALLAVTLLLACATAVRADEALPQPELQIQPEAPAAAVPAAVPVALPQLNDAAPAPVDVDVDAAVAPAPALVSAPVAALRVPVPKVTEAEFEALAHSGIPVFVKFYAPSESSDAHQQSGSEKSSVRIQFNRHF